MSFEFQPEKAAPSDRVNHKIPDRTYTAGFTGYRIYQRPNRDTGVMEDRLAWTFNVITKKGEFELPGFTSTKWGNADKPSVAREWVAAMLNKPVGSADLPRKLDDLVGRQVQVLTMTIGEGDQARSIIKAVLPNADELDF
jgi:hypothetical protein